VEVKVGVVVTVMNMKGGVGKTTIAVHLAGIAARFTYNKAPPRKVLAIDYDPQFNMSQSLLPPKDYFMLEKQRKTTMAILVDDDIDLNPFQLQVPGNHNPPSVDSIATKLFHSKHHVGTLDLVPSTLDLMYVALGQADAQVKPIEERFAKFIEECKSKYDHALLSEIKPVEATQKPVEATQKIVTDAFVEGEDTIHRLFLCTVGRLFWDNISSAAKKQLVSGLPGETKTALGLDSA
jgi:hypothetical protein